MGKGDKTDFALMDPRREGNQEKGTGKNTHSGRHELSGKNKSGKVDADEHGIPPPVDLQQIQLNHLIIFQINMSADQR